MQKVFASDFDGTLYFYKADCKFPEESVQMIKKYQEEGHLFGLCTGRQMGGLTPFMKGKVNSDFYITSSGANIVNRDLVEIRKCEMNRGTAAAIVKAINPMEYRITLDVEGEICVFEQMDYPGKYYIITSVYDAPPGRIHQVSIHTENPEDAAAMVKYINEIFGEQVNAFQNVTEVDIVPKGCSKGEGIQFLKEYLREKYGEVKLYGIGDSLNDLPLLEAADVSYTFPYAPKELQDKATKVVDTICDALLDSMNEHS